MIDLSDAGVARRVLSLGIAGALFFFAQTLIRNGRDFLCQAGWEKIKNPGAHEAAGAGVRQAVSGLEEGEVFAGGEALDEEAELHRVVVAPHAGFAVGDLLALGDVVPTIRTVIDAMKKQALMLRISA